MRVLVEYGGREARLVGCDCVNCEAEEAARRVPAGALGLLGLSGALELLPQRSNGAL